MCAVNNVFRRFKQIAVFKLEPLQHGTIADIIGMYTHAQILSHGNYTHEPCPKFHTFFKSEYSKEKQLSATIDIHLFMLKLAMFQIKLK